MAARLLLSGDERFGPRGDWGCSDCRGATWPGAKEGDKLREARNCDGEHPSQTLHFPWAPELNRCPLSLISPDASRHIGVWVDYKALGLLPCRGDLGDQPGHVFQGIELCELARIDMEHAERRRQEAEAERARAKAEAEAKRRGR